MVSKNVKKCLFFNYIILNTMTNLKIYNTEVAFSTINNKCNTLYSYYADKTPFYDIFAITF